MVERPIKYQEKSASTKRNHISHPSFFKFLAAAFTQTNSYHGEYSAFHVTPHIGRTQLDQKHSQQLPDKDRNRAKRSLLGSLKKHAHYDVKFIASHDQVISTS